MPAAFRLVSASGDQSFEIPSGRSLVVGRGVASDIAIYDPTISRRHAELIAGPDGVEVKDLGSSNGTCINGSRVAAGRDIWRVTWRDRQVGQATSASSERRMMKASKVLSQAGQAYS